MLELNGDWLQLDAATAPDGDADLEGVDFMSFRVPDCPRCGALLKPDVVFFGEHVPGARVERAFPQLPMTWLDTSAGDDCVFLLRREELSL